MLQSFIDSQFPSKAIHSNQAEPHPRLLYTVKRHLEHVYKKPIQTHNQQAFEQLLNIIKHNPHANKILDSGCGTGMSTRAIAHNNPNSLVIGIDQSFTRLSKQQSQVTPPNCIFLQANCEDIWRLCVQHQILFEHHTILYPNPYPKAEHLKRRWHGHPVFPFLLPLSNNLTMRSNWPLYLEEFSLAWQYLFTQNNPANRDAIIAHQPVTPFSPNTPLTLFERKYQQGGQDLFQWNTANAPTLP